MIQFNILFLPIRKLRPREVKWLVPTMLKLIVKLSSFFPQFHLASLREQEAKEKSNI